METKGESQLKENIDKKNDGTQNYILKIKELNNKINILIKGIKEEREKSKKLSEEIEVLKLDKILKEETISKLKSENESLNQILSKDDPKSYFENITKLNSDINFNPEEYSSMKKENIKLKQENKTLMDQNSEMKDKIEKLSESKKLEEKKLNEEIYKLKKERIEQCNDIFGKEKQIELLNGLYKEMEVKKISKEKEIIELKEEEKKQKKIFSELENKIMALEEIQNNKDDEIKKLKKEIEDKIKIEIDDYTFKGVIIPIDFNEKELYNKEVKIKFNSYDIYIYLEINNKIYKIDAKNIKFTFFEKSKDKVSIFYEIEEKENIINNEGGNGNEEEEDVAKTVRVTKAMLCQFTERECKYIFEFKKKMMEKYKENSKSFSFLGLFD